MKKILFIIRLLAMAGSCFALEAVHLEIYGDSQKNGGVKLTTPILELRTANHPDKYNLGILLTSRNLFKKLPVELKYGNLSASGALSKLNSPELSNGTSPFSNGISGVNLLSANLPGYTSFSKPESSFVQISMNQLTKRPFSLSFNLWASPDNQSPVFSTMISDKIFSRQLTLSAACLTGNFLYDENNSSSWFLDSPYYHSDSHLCSLFQLSADYKNKNGRTGVYSGFMAGFYETPFGPYTAVYRTDLKVSIKQNEFYTSAFLNAYEDTLTSSGKQLEPGLQLKTGMLSKKPVLTSKAELVLIQFGFNAYSKINFQKNEHPMRLNTGIQFTTDKTSVSFSVSDSALLKSENPEDPPEEFENESVSFQIKNSWYFKRLVPALTLSAEIKEAVKYKIQINLTNNAKQKLSGNIAYSFSEKDKEITSQKLSASLNCRFIFMNVRVIGKLAASVTM